MVNEMRFSDKRWLSVFNCNTWKITKPLVQNNFILHIPSAHIPRITETHLRRKYGVKYTNRKGVHFTIHTSQTNTVTCKHNNKFHGNIFIR